MRGAGSGNRVPRTVSPTAMGGAPSDIPWPQLAESVEVVEHGGMRRVPNIDLESSAAGDPSGTRWLVTLRSDRSR